MNIGFTGAYGTANFGDWAMLINNIMSLNELGNNNYYIYSYSSEFPKIMTDYYFTKKNIHNIEVMLKEEPFNNREIYTPLDCLLRLSNYEEILVTIQKLDVLLVCGGGWIEDSWVNRTEKWFKVMAPILIAAQNSIPIRFMSQGVGPIVNNKQLVRNFLNYLPSDTIFSVRDEYNSVLYLRDVVGEKFCVSYLPDDLLFLEKELIDKEYENKDSLKAIGDYIVLVVHEKMDYILQRSNEFVSFAQEMKTRYRVSVIVLPFDLVWFGSEQSNYLTKIMESSVLVEIEAMRFLSIERALFWIKNAKMVITGRYHASIVAINTLTPFIIKMGSDHSYSFNKATGTLRRLTAGINYNDLLFIRNDWTDIFQYVENEYWEIIKKQNDIFRNEKFKSNYNCLLQIRENFISNIFAIKKGSI